MKRTVIGVDIGSSAVKIAQTHPQENGSKLVNLTSDITKATGHKNSAVVIVVNSPKTTAKRVVLPAMPRGELKDAIELDAKTYFPFSIEDAAIDFEITGDVIEKGIKKSEVLVSVCPNSAINEALAFCDKHGLKPAQIIANSAALKNLLRSMKTENSGSTAFLDIGAQFSELVIFNGKSIWLVRKLPVSGKSFTEGMGGVLVSDLGRVELTVDEAERIKRDIGLPQDGASKDLIENKISHSQLFSMLRPVAERLANEIERSFDYYREDTGGLKVERLTLFGGGGLLKGLDKFLRESLDVDVEIGDPRKAAGGGASGGANIEPAAFAGAIGAALTDFKGTNLLPVGYKDAERQAVKKGVFKAVSASIAAIMVLTFMGLRVQLATLENKIYGSRLQLASLQPELARVSKNTATSAILADEPYWGDAFKELSALCADNICINEFQMEHQAVTLKGEIMPKEGGAENELADFVKSLESGIFKEARLLSTKKISPRSSEFEIKCRVE